MLFVGDDWAEDHHNIEIVNEEGRRLVRRPFGIVLRYSEAVLAINRTLSRDLYERVAVVVARRLIDVYAWTESAGFPGRGS